MYAVVSSGGKQYRVEAGNELILERVPGDAGASITFDRVLLVGDGDAVTVGTPTVEGATVSGTVLGEALGPKLIVFKFKQKATYRRKNGHRQHLMRVRIDEINASGSDAKPAKAATKASAKPDAEADATSGTAPEPAATKAETTQAEAKPDTAKAEKKPAARGKAAAAPEPTDEAKPKRTRKPAAKKAEAEE